MINVKTKEMYYSQFGEDKILAAIFHKEQTGLCIEVGANDGVNDSTTMYFEKMGWNCILVEPNPILCKSIRSSRNSTLIEVAASDKNGSTSLFVAAGAERAHGVSTIDSTPVALDRIKSYGFTYTEVQVKTSTLNEILGNLKIDRAINFISIDVEGHELQVLEGFSLKRWKPMIILLEDNSNFTKADVSNYLEDFGYLRFMRTGVNDWYAHKSNKQLVNWHSRSQYNWIVYKTRVKNSLRKIPGVLRIKNFLTKYHREL